MSRIILRLPAVLKRRGKSRSSHYADVNAGLFVPPVNLCLRARGTPDDEVDILGAATIADKSEVEIRALVVKLLLAELLRAPAVIEFDNLTGDLVAHKSLCAALTSKHMSGRILGVSKTATVNTRALLLSSGNNVGPVQDMTRRCLTIHLSPECEVPAARSFTRPDLVRDVLRDRGRNVSAALTIVPGNAQPPADCLASGVRQDGGDGARRREAGVGFPRRAC